MAIDSERVERDPAHDPDRIVVDRRLYLTADRQELVEQGDPRARYLWAAGAGFTVDRAEADRLGYAAKSGQVQA